MIGCPRVFFPDPLIRVFSLSPVVLIGGSFWFLQSKIGLRRPPPPSILVRLYTDMAASRATLRPSRPPSACALHRLGGLTRRDGPKRPPSARLPAVVLRRLSSSTSERDTSISTPPPPWRPDTAVLRASAARALPPCAWLPHAGAALAAWAPRLRWPLGFFAAPPPAERRLLHLASDRIDHPLARDPLHPRRAVDPYSRLRAPSQVPVKIVLEFSAYHRSSIGLPLRRPFGLQRRRPVVLPAAAPTRTSPLRRPFGP